MYDILRLKQYRKTRSRQLQTLDAINWLTGTLPHHERSVAVTMKVMDEFRKTQVGGRLPLINPAFTAGNEDLEFKQNLTQYGLPHLFRTSDNTWKTSKEPKTFNAETKFKLPALSNQANHMFPSSRGSLRVRVSYRNQDGVSYQRKKVSLSSHVFSKSDIQTRYRLEKR